MGRLVEIHEIHVNFRPGQVAIVLRVQMYKWLIEKTQTGDPHFCRGEGVHPGNQADAVLSIIRFPAEFGDGIRGCHYRLENDFHR